MPVQCVPRLFDSLSWGLSEILQLLWKMVPEKIIDTSLVISLLVFGLRVLIKETKAVLGDLFQLVEFAIRWWIYIKNLINAS